MSGFTDHLRRFQQQEDQRKAFIKNIGISSGLRQALSVSVQIREQAEQQRRFMRGIVSTSTSLKFSNHFRPIDLKLNTFKNDILDRYKAFIDSFKKGIIETEEDVKIFKEAMVAVGYPPSERLDLHKLRLISKAIKSKEGLPTVQSIDRIMQSYYNESAISYIGAEWESKQHIANRLSILRNIIMGHNLKMFNLSVPAAIAQFEGIIFQSFEVKGRTNNEILKALLEVLLYKTDTFSYDKEIYTFYADRVTGGFRIGKEIESDTSRNAILHGYDIEYGNEIVSLKMILFLDHIIESTSDIPENIMKVGKAKVAEVRRKQAGRNRRR